MSFSQKAPVLAASIAAAALIIAAPASAQTSTKLISNQAGPQSNTMAKSTPAPDARSSTTSQSQDGEKGSGLMAKASNHR